MTPFLSLLSLLAVSIVAARLLSRPASAANDHFLAFADTVPSIMWEERDNRILWANAAHENLQKKCNNGPLVLNKFALADGVSLKDGAVRAELIAQNSSVPLLYNVSMHQFQGHIYYYGQSAIEVAKAEEERKRFVQNLSQTFAHLPVGVAVFDRDRDLSLFNPALSNLLELAPSWLAARPSLRSFLDQLREGGALPEPKDFKSWRQQITNLENSASNGVYFEDWNLPNGHVYRVTGKPQPKGAVALFVEDISGPVGVEREYRSEIKRLYNGFDALNMGLAIFYPSGDLSFANNHFDQLWGLDISESVLVPNVITITRALQEKCEPTPIWGDLRDFVSGVEERVDWSTDLLLKDGQQISARFVPLPEGQTLCEFALVNPVPIPQSLSAKTKTSKSKTS